MTIQVMNSIGRKVGQRIAKLRRLAGLTQAQLAERAGVQPETMSRIENGRRTPSLGRSVALAAALGMDLHELFRFRVRDESKDRAIEMLHRFASFLSADEIELLMSVGGAVLKHVRGARVG